MDGQCNLQMTQVQQEIEEGNFSVTDEKAGSKHYTLYGED